jgi:hypothetical protein
MQKLPRPGHYPATDPPHVACMSHVALVEASWFLEKYCTVMAFAYMAMHSGSGQRSAYRDVEKNRGLKGRLRCLFCPSHPTHM